MDRRMPRPEGWQRDDYLASEQHIHWYMEVCQQPFRYQEQQAQPRPPQFENRRQPQPLFLAPMLVPNTSPALPQMALALCSIAQYWDNNANQLLSLRTPLLVTQKYNTYLSR